MSHKLSLAVVAAAASLALGVGSAFAGSKTLGDTGWVATWDNSLNEVVSLSVDPGTGVVTEKFADFRNFDPVSIVFQQAGASATPTLTVAMDSEFLINHTDQAWNSFEMSLLSGVNGTTSIARFEQASTGIGSAGGFSISPFTTGVYSADGRTLTLSGGTVGNVPPDNVWQPGVASGRLVISTAPAASGALASFVLMERPVVGTVIPLPAAAWTGLSGLVGLGLLGAARRVRSLIA